MRKLRIAIAATVHKKVSKDSTGGTEIFAYLLSEELVKRGHDVTLFAASDSTISCRLIGIEVADKMNTMEQGERIFYGYQLLAAQKLVLSQDDFDIIHCNYFEPFLFTPFSKNIKQPIIYTVHSDLFDTSPWQEVTQKTVKPSDTFTFVAKHAYDKAILFENKQYIYNGIDTDSFDFSLESDDYLFWLGRVRRKKGMLQAVQAVAASGKRLILSGVIDNESEKEFFDTDIAPFIQNHSNISFIGPSIGAEKKGLYQKAKGFLFPIMWEEPFGLTMLEAMSCGTPVIAYAQGAVPEVIEDGVSGFIVNASDSDIRGDFLVKKTGVSGLQEAIQYLYALPEEIYKDMRKNARKQVEERFSITKMVDAYERLYETIANNK